MTEFDAFLNKMQVTRADHLPVIAAFCNRIGLTDGYSKDHTPDLKQFLIKMLCVGRNIPILGRCEDGNASDKSINNAVLSRISKHMAKYGLQPGAFVYITDSAMVTRDNLEMIGDNLFLTRLPFSYNEAGRVVSEAVAKKQLGRNRYTQRDSDHGQMTPCNIYSVAEKTVTLYQQPYRALVIHSTAHDKRRLKRIGREIKTSETTLTKLIAQETKQEFYCRPDAESAASRLNKSDTELHGIAASVEEKVHYVRGRPPKNGPRKVAYIRYVLEAKIQEKTEQIERKRKEAGCFVLLTNILRQGDMAETGAELLQAYKEQNGIERNFSFLKDPLIVNDLFLKKPERIEALGAVLLMALMIWNLIEHTLKKAGILFPDGITNRPGVQLLS